MNRVDRLLAIALHLQGRRVVRAEDRAAHFEISVRTVYRDIAAPGESGIPILAEARRRLQPGQRVLSWQRQFGVLSGPVHSS